ncbi:MFS general substrate transporter [Fistulina hepatica ATCC 64428]|uniref:MFS general substrate transporter n=1 Tax=Fistulina hepatica ATCC 64428 TaxID=1128425 RepID=A0A0D7A4P5_9AGAR|nr:MFS general substrate transporter [Fistulina hepatica ATCC 64428]
MSPFQEKSSYDDEKKSVEEAVHEVSSSDDGNALNFNCRAGIEALILATVEIGAVYTPEQYGKLKRKIDLYLLPLMWLCYGVQQTDKTSLGTMATFGLEGDLGLVGQQYSWLTTIFYITYMCFEFPSNIVLQRWRMGKTLSIYMICWGVVVLCIGFTHNFKQIVALRALQGFFECCISPGFILVVGSWYTRAEHASRALVFQSANAGFGVISSLILYGIGSLQYSHPDMEPWRYMSYLLGGLTVAVGILCLYFLGTPSEVPWLTHKERRMANSRILENQSGHDRTGTTTWKWYQARECLIDPCFYFSGINAFLSSVPNGGLTTFGALLNKSFGFTNLQVILIGIPINVTSVLIFVIVGVATHRYKNIRLYVMAAGAVPPFVGFLGMSLIETSASTRWTKWGMYYMTVPFVLSLFLAWTLIPTNIPGRTKRTVTSSFTFVGYCVGNMCGSQIFRSDDAPKYTSGTIGCCICFGIQFFLVCTWRTVLVLRNRRRHRAELNDGLTPEQREIQGKINGESDLTDFENPYVRQFSSLFIFLSFALLT